MVAERMRSTGVCDCCCGADKLRRLLVERDAESCSLKRSESFATNIKAHMKRICPQTQLPYRECCGRKNKLNLGAKLKQKRLLQQAL